MTTGLYGDVAPSRRQSPRIHNRPSKPRRSYSRQCVFAPSVLVQSLPASRLELGSVFRSTRGFEDRSPAGLGARKKEDLTAQVDKITGAFCGAVLHSDTLAADGKRGKRPGSTPGVLVLANSGVSGVAPAENR
jgi:hypothetical protein